MTRPAVPSSLQCPRRPPEFLSWLPKVEVVRLVVRLVVEDGRKDCVRVKVGEADFEWVEMVGHFGKLGNDEVVKGKGRKEVERQKERERESWFVEEQENVKLGETEEKRLEEQLDEH